MSDNHQDKKKKPYFKAIFWGIISISAYTIVFTNQDIVTQYFTKGGVYAAFPIVTAFFFSFIHGFFSNYVLSLLGIEAKKKI
jgi:hypothetical protein